MSRSRFLTLSMMILAAALSRLIPHPPNVTPITAMALFGGYYFSCPFTAFLVPLVALFASDLIIGLHSQLLTVYLSFILITAIGLISNKRQAKFSSIPLATVGCSILFFLITNFGVWLLDHLYPKTLQGLWTCYTAAIPFFRNSLLGDLLYVAILFVPFAIAQKKYPSLQESTPKVGLSRP